MANYQSHRVPDFARALGADIVQLHSSDYRNPAQLRDGGVLIVGAGNSGAEIARSWRGTHEVLMSRPQHGRGAVQHRQLRRRARSSRASCCAWSSIAC